MIKACLHIVFCVLAITAFGQDNKETWQKEREKLNYKKGDQYKGPNDWYGTNPTNLRNIDYTPSYSSGSSSGGTTIPGSGYRPGSGSGSGSSRNGGSSYSPQQIQKDRQRQFGDGGRGTGGGPVKFEPDVEKPKRERDNRRDFEYDYDYEDDDDNSSSSSSWFSSGGSSSGGGSSSIWTILMYVLLLAVICVVAYLIIRNMKPKNQKVIVDVQNDWNPETISKTELELKLEAASEANNFRECVRIYFTFILKELIKKGWIHWKKEKTNHHYVIEMGRRNEALGFMECVRIYDLVWYGNYDIDPEVYEMLRPTLEAYYKSLDPSDE